MAEEESGVTAPTPKRYFGPQLRQYRERYALWYARTPDTAGVSRAMEMARECILYRLNEAGITTNAALYAQIEAGEVLPQPARAFLGVVVGFLGLSGDQLRDLEMCLAFDTLDRRLEKRAPQAIDRPSE